LALSKKSELLKRRQGNNSAISHCQLGFWFLAGTFAGFLQVPHLSGCYLLEAQFFAKILFSKLCSDGVPMAPQHSARFLRIVEDAKKRVREVGIEDVKARLDRGDKFVLVDVREESEYAKEHLPEAIHLGKGIIERDIEERVPDLNTPIVLYCGGGYRSALAADNLQKMGYTNVLSMDGGIRGWREKHFPLAL
jgi:rhodanese-related sulfurtransferase